MHVRAKNARLRWLLDIGGGKSAPTGKVDIGMIQSLNRKGEVKDVVADYGHHQRMPPSLSLYFRTSVRQVNAKYVVGLTAKPIRKDDHHVGEPDARRAGYRRGRPCTPVLLIGTGLMRHSFEAMLRDDFDFKPANVLSFDLMMHWDY